MESFEKIDTSLLASNAYVLLVSDYFPLSKTQCAVFKGTDRTVFLDKREFTGPVYEQIEEATTFVLRNIRLGATIEGLLRKEAYELPIEAIREMIVNAHCHRNLTDASCVQVAVYDDRLEVTSPGGLYNGLPSPEIQIFDDMFRVNLYRRPLSEMSNDSGEPSENVWRRFKRYTKEDFGTFVCGCKTFRRKAGATGRSVRQKC